MKKLSIIVPCYNEESTIEEVLDRLNDIKIDNIEKEIIVIDDGSNDNSRQIIKKNMHKVQKLLYHEKNLGKSAALRTGIKNATGDYIIIQDADLEYNPSEYNKLLKPLLKNECDVVYGSRFKNNKYNKGYIQNRIANNILTKLCNFFTNYKLTDVETCYKLFKSEIIKNIEIEENRFGFEIEITVKLIKLKANIIEIPIKYEPRTKKEGKKIGFKDGLRAIYCMLKYR